MKPSWVGMVAVLYASTALAGVEHYKPMAERLAKEGEAFYQAKQPTRALESFVRLFHYDGDYEPAAVGMLRTAQILLAQKGPGEIERRYAATLLLRYVLGTPTVERAARTSPCGIDPVGEATALLRELGKDATPLSNSMGHRKGADAALPGAKKLITDAMEAAHRAMPSGAQGRYERELGVLRAEWQDPAKKALADLLAARDRLSPDQRYGVILAACADSRDEGRSYEPPPCAILQKEWPAAGTGLTERLRPLVTDVDPGWHAAALFFLHAGGGVPTTEAPAQRGQFLHDAEHDRARAEAALGNFAGQSIEQHRAAFEEVMQGWLDAGRGEKNPYPVEQRLSLAYRALYAMRGGPDYVRKIARDQDPLRRASVAWALACSHSVADLVPSNLPSDASELVQTALAVGVGECADPQMAFSLEPIFHRGTPHAAIEAARALKRVAEKGPFRTEGTMLLKLAGTAFQRTDLGGDELYVFQDVLEAMRSCNDPKVVGVAVKMKAHDAYLAERQLELLYTKAPLDPETAIKFAEQLLGDPNRSVMRLAEKVVDRAKDELKRRR